ncbi:MAG: hypothetical protein UMU04_02365 [Halanaerobiales bacterium]|nr:hypothetical protein [Halanaerobiales bacterium]
MVKETSTFKIIKTAVDPEEHLEENFRRISDILAENHDIQLYFCRVIGGRRWSFCSGYPGIISAKKRINIDDEFGLIIGRYENLSEEEWEKICELIRKLSDSDND